MLYLYKFAFISDTKSRYASGAIARHTELDEFMYAVVLLLGLFQYSTQAEMRAINAHRAIFPATRLLLHSFMPYSCIAVFATFERFWVFTACRKANFASAVGLCATANSSLRLSVPPSVTLRILCQNERTQRDAVFAIG